MDITERRPVTVRLASGEEITIREHDARLERNRARHAELARLRQVARTTTSWPERLEAAQATSRLASELEAV